ncbi:MAG: hypothetical protein LBL63_02910 [Clostridiales Family XIII bacterium]|nr:hypothetical protein [Clostridiales Family XIII bacterium]
MKTLIVFAGVLVLALFSLSFQCDRNRMAAAEYRLKDIAVECAFDAVVLMRRERLSARDERVSDCVAAALAAGSARISFGADDGGAFDFTLIEGEGTITVSVTARTEDFFRLPIFSVTKLSASATVPVV